MCVIFFGVFFSFFFLTSENAEETVKEICCKSCANIQINQPASLANTLLVLHIPFYYKVTTEMLKKTPFCDILKDFSENEPSGIEMWHNSYLRTQP